MNFRLESEMWDEMLETRHPITDEIIAYFEARGLKYPDALEALAFETTEKAEAYEILLARKTWQRNNPDSKPNWSPDRLAEELGDMIMMAVVAGVVEGVCPISALRNKMRRNLS
jgi:hypothetical protein